MSRKRVLLVFGTRPEAIKMAPVVRRLRERSADFETVVAVTAQHREMLDQVLEVFSIEPDFDLDIMLPRQTLTQVTTRALDRLTPVIEEVTPDAILVQGDTTTTFVAALAAFYHKVPVGHVEAGLRTGDIYQPYPEEMNRRLTSQLARWHFAPTATSSARLLGEGVDPSRVHVTGNTVIDALLEAVEMEYEFPPGPVADALAGGERIVLMTMHRRENWGQPARDVCQAVLRLAREFDDVRVLFSVHKNPAVRETVQGLLGGTPRVDLIEPLDYLPFVKLMQAATLILSDSGGMQEEAPSLGKPVLVLRNKTERPEAIEAGTARLVGTDTDTVFAEAARLLSDPVAYDEMAQASNPFGDGRAAQRIADILAGS
ncbi:MAG: UDP-N-acetylglucosamine 2-epimerase (non-hydrolyzing) [Coriobacteriia bacterium]